MNLVQLKFDYCPFLVAIFYSTCTLFAVGSGQSCGPKVSPRLLREIPCDMSVSSYCTQPGSAYPWSSVRRYIFENQGSMKRMYGEQRQSQIIQEEIYRLNDKYGTIDVDSGRSAKQETIEENSLDEPHSDDRDADKNSQAEMGAAPAHNTSNSANVADINATINHLENITSKHAAESEDFNEIYTSTIAENLNGIEMYWAYNNQTNQDQADPEENQTTPSAEQDIDEVPAKEVQAKGYNACPITQEVVAPYWANNTRGETLALLNVYPFEQYIHWEKCAFEEEQMFCRDGCRCEQQYRLHRLLAFDPKNECRGIFADWFRFPGCCVCICYDNQERINTRKARL